MYIWKYLVLTHNFQNVHITLTIESREICLVCRCRVVAADSPASDRRCQRLACTILAVEINCTCRLWYAICHPHTQWPKWDPHTWRTQRLDRVGREAAETFPTIWGSRARDLWEKEYRCCYNLYEILYTLLLSKRK